ncbi:MAG: sulfite exporter TauE/SafE family protein [Chloroflexota bacterium]|nr:sulfite exporter TauE/SafE family protein [Chloroflexota bacterium]
MYFCAFLISFKRLSGVVGYAIRGDIDITAVLTIVAGTVVGSILGARFANKVNEKTLNRVVSVVFFCLGITMIVLGISSKAA